MNTQSLSLAKKRTVQLLSAVVCALGLLLGFSAQKAEAQVSVSFEYFQDSLQPYGNWVEVDQYGPCWVPNTGYDDWRPYSDGSWAYTESGWTWVSEEPWGWATYHYGRWVYLDGPGWAWVPGYEWGPAWVAWRTSDDYIGWAPLPPEAVWVPRRGFSVNVNFNFGPTYYNFCETRHFGSRRLRDVIFRPERNITIINNTVNVTRIVNNNTTIINEGPNLEAVNRRSERRIERLQLERRDQPNGNLRAERRGDRLEVFSPKVSAPEQTDRVQRAETRAVKTQNEQTSVAGDSTAKRNVEQRNVARSDRAKELNAAPPERQNNRRNSESRVNAEPRQSRVVAPTAQTPASDRIVPQEKPAIREDRVPQVREQKREPRVREQNRAPQVREQRQVPQVREQKREPRVRPESPRVQEARQERVVQSAPAPERQRERSQERPAQVREMKRENPQPADQQPPTLEQLTERKRRG